MKFLILFSNFEVFEALKFLKKYDKQLKKQTSKRNDGKRFINPKQKAQSVSKIFGQKFMFSF